MDDDSGRRSEGRWCTWVATLYRAVDDRMISCTSQAVEMYMLLHLGHGERSWDGDGKLVVRSPKFLSMQDTAFGEGCEAY